MPAETIHGEGKHVPHMCEESGVTTGIDIVQVTGLSRKLRDLVQHDTDSYLLRAGRSCNLIQTQND